MCTIIVFKSFFTCTTNKHTSYASDMQSAANQPQHVSWNKVVAL